MDAFSRGCRWWSYFATVNQESPNTVTGFTGSNVQVDDFGVTESDDLQLELRSSSGQGATVKSINVSDESNGKYVYKEFSENNSVEVGSELVFDLPNVSQGDSSNNLDVEIFYDTGGLSNLSVSGSISGSLSVDETTEVGGDGGGSGGSWSEPVSSAPDCSSYPATYSGSGTEGDPYIVMNSTDLQCMNQSFNGNYTLGQNINASGTENWNTGKGFKPIGNLSENYNGSFNGDYQIISGLTINRPNNNYTGLFGHVGTYGIWSASQTGSVNNLSLINIDVTGSYRTGGLVGHVGPVDIVNVSVEGSVDGGDETGGVIGNDETGLYGYSANLYSAGEVNGSNRVGGITGEMPGNGLLDNGYSLADVNGNNTVGGVAGDRNYDYSGEQWFASGNVTAKFQGYGVAGGSGPTYSPDYTYWDNETSNADTSKIGIALDSVEIKGSAATSNLNGFNFTTTWETVDASDGDASSDGYPVLRSLSRERQLTAQGIYSE